jgi:hypothetical protein
MYTQQISLLLLSLLLTVKTSTTSFFNLRTAGPPVKVVDLVIIAEAYVSKETFIEDAERLTEKLFSTAYRDFAPIISVHGLYVKSVDDNVGQNGHAINTPFQLYREPSSPLRSILPTDGHTYEYAKELCRKYSKSKSMCDYIVIMAHDSYYGGLGDDIAIVSSSKTTGDIGLRHELGHNFADIGEEYDGGRDYSGGNFALTRRICQENEVPRRINVGGGIYRDVWPCISWTKWLTNPLPIGVDVVQEETSALTLAKWPWYQFRQSSSHRSSGSRSNKFEFYVDGNSGLKGRIVFSTAGISNGAFMDVLLDGISLRGDGMLDEGALTYPNHNDRYFQTIIPKRKFNTGKHVIEFIYYSNNNMNSNKRMKKSIIPPQLCHIMVYTLGDNYHDHPSYVGAYPVYSEPGKLEGYRPTDNSCLMRSMESPSLCPICRELIWKNFAEKYISFIHGATYSMIIKKNSGINDVKNQYVQVKLQVPLLGVNRKNIDPKDNNSKENILIEWYRGTNGIVEEISLKNAQEWSRPWKDGHGCWRVEATYLTAHVRGIPSKMKTMKSTHYVYIDPNDYKKLTSGGKSDVPVTIQARDRCPMSHSGTGHFGENVRENYIRSKTYKPYDTAYSLTILCYMDVTVFMLLMYGMCISSGVFCNNSNTSSTKVNHNRKKSKNQKRNLSSKYTCWKCIKKWWPLIIVAIIILHIAFVFMILVHHQEHDRSTGPLETTPFDYISMKKSPPKPPPPQEMKHIAKSLNHIRTSRDTKSKYTSLKIDIKDENEGNTMKGNDNIEKYENNRLASSFIGGHGIKKIPLLKKRLICRTTLESAYFMVDDKGGYCKRSEMNTANGCCPSSGTDIALNDACDDTCDTSKMCCKTYEKCVSCCMHRLHHDNSDGSENDINSNSNQQSPQHFDYGVDIMKHSSCFSKDVFDSCTCRCRTASQTTIHENQYKSELSKHCYFGKHSTKRSPLEVRIARRGHDCISTCSMPRDDKQQKFSDDGSNYVCDDIDLFGLNKCNILKKYFPCEKGCFGNIGSDQPAYVVGDDGTSSKKCFFNKNKQYFSCSGRHGATQRLCPCRKEF